MTINVLGYAAASAKADLVSYRLNVVTRAPTWLLRFLYCGICHITHYVNNDQYQHLSSGARKARDSRSRRSIGSRC